MNQSEKELITASIQLLRLTLGDMPSQKADAIVAEVVRILQSI